MIFVISEIFGVKCTVYVVSATDVMMFRFDDDNADDDDEITFNVAVCVCPKIHLSIELNFVVDFV